MSLFLSTVDFPNVCVYRCYYHRLLKTIVHVADPSTDKSVLSVDTMETEWLILNRIWDMRRKTKCRKFVGALTTELVRKELLKLGFNVSNRDVFIEGIPYELDLLVIKSGKQPKENMVYHPDDVLAVLEIKFRGSYGRGSIDKVGRVFDSIKSANKKLECFYISVSENKNYKYRVTRENLGYDCFELLTRESNLESALRRGCIRRTRDWQKLLSKLRGLTSSRSSIVSA